PMLGGANSSEVRVHLGGYMNLGPYPRLGDVVAEIGPARGGNAQPAERYEDQRKLDAVAAEKNIALFLNTRVRWVGKKGDRIVSVTGQDVVTGERTDFEAPLFADCTGDANVGFLAGADFRMGRESKAETGEDMAPDKADKMTMGASVQWYTKDAGSAVAFPAEPWMIAFNEQNCEHGMRGDWDWETGMMRDQIIEFERIRDYGMLVVYSNWSFLKNKSAKRAKYASREFEWVAYVAGKRESRRLMGDHILTQQDVFDFVPYPDGTCCTTWAIDLHYPMPRNTKHYDGEPFRSICTHNKHYAYPIPYRCLYSRNVANLFMAGRNISVTHVALGTTRVMRTTGMMGEVVGMAARVCKDRGCLPRGVYTDHLAELKALMKKGVGTGRPQPPQNYNRGALIPGTPAEAQGRTSDHPAP
ncbi:MAG: FAD-dependent oxidoreductase, partial [Kiritimatiellae bacterium]|nr:FAD-dependent oxidoreductase [Kiritimatiellia bacterium]